MVEALDAIGALQLTRLREPVAAIAQSVLKPLALKVAAARALCCACRTRVASAALREVLRAFRSDGRSYAVQVTGELRVTSWPASWRGSRGACAAPIPRCWSRRWPHCCRQPRRAPA